MPKYIIENGVAREVKKFKNSDSNPDENIAKELEEKTVPELREVAKELEIELKTKDTKEEIIKKISEVM